MAKAAKKEKKDNGIVYGIIMIVAGLLAVIFGADYLWVLFNVIEIPLQIVGAIFAVLGVISLVVGIREKKKAKQAASEQQNQQ